MTLEVQPLWSTRFRDLDVTALHIDSRLPRPDAEACWHAAVDEGILLTQLRGSSAEMREYDYYYLLAVNGWQYFIESEVGALRILRAAPEGSKCLVGLAHSDQYVLDIGRQGIDLLYKFNSKPWPLRCSSLNENRDD